MANQGAKNRRVENIRHMRSLLRYIIACNLKRLTAGYLIVPILVGLLVVQVLNWDSVVVEGTKRIVFLVVRAGIYHSSFGWKHWVGLALTSLTYYFTYNQLASMAKPSYGDDGDLLDGGFDMSTGGICGYIHDVIYITGFVQIGSIISGKFWYTFLVIPGFAAYKCFDLIKGFLPNGSEGPEEDEKTRKKREKLERKASRANMVKTRTR